MIAQIVQVKDLTDAHAGRIVTILPPDGRVVRGVFHGQRATDRGVRVRFSEASTWQPEILFPAEAKARVEMSGALPSLAEVLAGEAA